MTTNDHRPDLRCEPGVCLRGQYHRALHSRDMAVEHCHRALEAEIIRAGDEVERLETINAALREALDKLVTALRQARAALAERSE